VQALARRQGVARTGFKDVADGLIQHVIPREIEARIVAMPGDGRVTSCAPRRRPLR
jgi:hypothetical protein